MKEKDAAILVVDDQPANLKVLLTFLERNGFVVHIAENGEVALRTLLHFHPDLILLDVMMPGIDGLETCRQIKANKNLADIPVIYITALESVEDKAAGFAAGGVDYITKPFELVEVLARIRTHITLKRQKEELEQALAEVKKLSGFLPICSFCKKIRNDKGYWQQVEHYIARHSEAQFSHGVCEECAQEHYGEILREIEQDENRDKEDVVYFPSKGEGQGTE